MAASGLIIRRNERHEISLPAQVRVSFSHTELVKLSKGTAGEKGWVNVHLIDFSENGIGIVTEVFFPRGSVLEVRVPDLGDPFHRSLKEPHKLKIMLRRAVLLMPNDVKHTVE